MIIWVAFSWALLFLKCAGPQSLFYFSSQWRQQGEFRDQRWSVSPGSCTQRNASWGWRAGKVGAFSMCSMPVGLLSPGGTPWEMTHLSLSWRELLPKWAAGTMTRRRLFQKRSVVLTDENHPYQNEYLTSELLLLCLKVMGIPEQCRTVGAALTETLLPSLCGQVCVCSSAKAGVWCVAHTHCLPGTWLGTCGCHKAPVRAASSCLGCCCALPASRSREKHGWASSGAISIFSGHVSRSNKMTAL